MSIMERSSASFFIASTSTDDLTPTA